MKINKQNKNGKELSIIYGDDNSININIFNNKILMGIVGSFDKNIKELERITGSKIYFRGNSISIKGNKSANQKVKNAIVYLVERLKTEESIDRNDIFASVNKGIIEDGKENSTIH